jgi:hypothetical protein
MDEFLDGSSNPLDVFSSGGSGDVTTADQNPSNGLDLNSLMGSLIGGGTQAFVASQNSAAAQSIAQAQIASLQANPGNPLAIFSGPNGKFYIYLGVGLLALALILRR